MHRWRLNRKQRLHAAPEWIRSYAGKDIVRGYRRWFRVDRLCALVELKMCGVEISDERIEAARRDLEQLGAKRAEKKALHALEFGPDQDDNFAYIVGYTSGGAPYGLTWEEWELTREVCSSQSIGISLVSWFSENPSGSLPARIASIMSGASSVSRRIRAMWCRSILSASAISIMEPYLPSSSSFLREWGRAHAYF